MLLYFKKIWRYPTVIHWLGGLSIFLVTHISSLSVVASTLKTVAHFTEKNGLASNTIYEIHEDKKGFIWICSDGGIMRYNGRDFEHFNTDNGLPDNIVLGAYEDSKGRLWLRLYNRKVAYIHNNRVFTAKEDTALAKLQFQSFVLFFLEDGNGHLWISDGKETLIFNGIDVLHRIKGLFETFRDDETYFTHLSRDSIFSFRINRKYEIVDWTEIDCHQIPEHIQNQFKRIRILFSDCLVYPQTSMMDFGEKFRPRFVSIEKVGNDHLYGSMKGGLFFKPEHLGVKKIMNEEVTFIRFDSYENIWIATKSNGVFVLKKTPIDLVDLSECLFTPASDLVSLTSFENCLYTADKKFAIYRFCACEEMNCCNLFSDDLVGVKRPWVRLDSDEDGIKLFSDEGLIQIDGNGQPQQIGNYRGGAPKDFHLDTRSNVLYLCASAGIWRWQEGEWSNVHETRSFAVCQDSADRKWFSTADGIYYLNQSDQLIKSNIPFQDNYVKILHPYNSGLLLISDGNGLSYWDGFNLLEVNISHGLVGNVFTDVLVDDQKNIWLGSNKGLNRIRLNEGNNEQIEVVSFTEWDGLNTNYIRDLERIKTDLFILTRDGINVIDLNRNIVSKRGVEAHLNGILVNGEPVELELEEYLTFEFEENDLEFQFTSLSMTTYFNGELRYKLQGLDRDWKITKGQSVRYLNLPPGQYSFEIVSNVNNPSIIDQQGSSISFRIRNSFWKSGNSKVLLSVLVFSLLLGFVCFSYLSYRKRNELENRINELRYKALQSQMNPHFIFNALQAIQYLFNSGQLKRANRAMADFSLLIRRVLEHSEFNYISLYNEKEILNLYISIEKVRFDHSFDFEMIFQGASSSESFLKQTTIPTMVLQPLVENCVKHGISKIPKGLRRGKIEVRFSIEEEYLRIEVEDNGVGFRTLGETSFTGFKERKHVGIKNIRSRLATYSSSQAVFQQKNRIVNGEVLGSHTSIIVHLQQQAKHKKVLLRE